MPASRVTRVFAFAGSPAVLTRPLLACYAVSGAIHLASISLNTLLPFHVVALGGSRTQVGLLFSATTVVSMFLRPVVGGWVDRVGARPLLLPGIALLAGASVVLHAPATPEAVIAVMMVAGTGNGLVSMSANILTVRASSVAHRGQALSLYYLASSLAIAVAPPMALGLRALGGMHLAFAAVTVFAALLLPLVLAVPAAMAAPAAGPPPAFRPLSPRAIPESCALVLTTVGSSSIYAFLPLYVASRGQGGRVVWFFALYSAWLIVGRALFGGLSDRVGPARVVVPAMALVALGYFALALPPAPASLAAGALLLGSGGAVLYPTLATLVVARAAERERGLALGTLSGAWDLGVVIGSALIGFVVDRGSFGTGFVVAGGFSLLGAGAFAVTERRRRDDARRGRRSGARVREPAGVRGRPSGEAPDSD